MKSIGMIETKRTVNHATTNSARFFITALSYERFDDFMRRARKHCDVEINLYWPLDVSFKEDHSRVRTGNLSGNLATSR